MIKGRGEHLIISLVLCSFISFSSHAAKISIKKLRDNVSNQSLKISKLAAKIRSVDKKISRTNDEYLDKMKRIDQLENGVVKLKEELSQSAETISTEFKLVKKALDLYLLEATSDNGGQNFTNPKIYFEVLKTKIKDLKMTQVKSQSLLESLNMYDQRLTESRKTEEALYRVIYDLENQKKSMGHNYISLMEDHNINQGKLDEVLAKKKAKRKVYNYKKRSSREVSIPIQLGMPIVDFIDAKKGKKGVSFKYNEMLPLKAPAAGKVSYAGDLANYGKVIMIDHGKNIISVLLGDIALKVEKGTLLEQGQIVGYTVADPGIKKTLYYEVRKKNIVQNTYKWLAKNNKNFKI